MGLRIVILFALINVFVVLGDKITTVVDLSAVPSDVYRHHNESQKGKLIARYGMHRTYECKEFEKAYICVRKCTDFGFDLAVADKHCKCTCFEKRDKKKFTTDQTKRATKWRLGPPTTKKPYWAVIKEKKKKLLFNKYSNEDMNTSGVNSGEVMGNENTNYTDNGTPGLYENSTSIGEVADESNNATGSGINVPDDSNNITDGSNKVTDGSNKVSDGSNKVTDNSNNITDGSNKVTDGSNNFTDGSNNVPDDSKNNTDDSNNVTDDGSNVTDGSNNVPDDSNNNTDNSNNVTDSGNIVTDGSNNDPDDSNDVTVGSTNSTDETTTVLDVK